MDNVLVKNALAELKEANIELLRNVMLSWNI